MHDSTMIMQSFIYLSLARNSWRVQDDVYIDKPFEADCKVSISSSIICICHFFKEGIVSMGLNVMSQIILTLTAFVCLTWSGMLFPLFIEAASFVNLSFFVCRAPSLRFNLLASRALSILPSTLIITVTIGLTVSMPHPVEIEEALSISWMPREPLIMESIIADCVLIMVAVVSSHTWMITNNKPLIEVSACYEKKWLTANDLLSWRLSKVFPLVESPCLAIMDRAARMQPMTMPKFASLWEST